MIVVAVVADEVIFGGCEGVVRLRRNWGGVF